MANYKFKTIFMLFIVSLLTFLYNLSHSGTFPDHTHYQVCFTPGGDCTNLIVNEIERAHQSVYVQAYSFTSIPIAKAIISAYKRGLKVIVIVDKSQIHRNVYSAAKYLMRQHIPLWIDYEPEIAHNKVILLDDRTVITGSFNFTKAAQNKNAENVLIIHDAGLVSLYKTNLMHRLSLSKRGTNRTLRMYY